MMSNEFSNHQKLDINTPDVTTWDLEVSNLGNDAGDDFGKSAQEDR